MISLSRLRAALSLSAGEDQKVERTRSVVIAQFEQDTGYLWNAREDYVQSSKIPEFSNYVELALRPVTTITLVRTSVGAGGFSDLSSSNYMILNNRLLSLAGSWPMFVEVTMDGGYDETTCPEDIQYALEVQAKYMLARQDAAHLVVRSQNFEGGSGVFESADRHPVFIAAVRAHRRIG